MSSLPDWKLPPGVSRGVWDYVNDSSLACAYDARLAGSPLLQFDLRFVERFFTKPGRLIDLGCGTGRLLVPFAQRGFQVLGVDLSQEMLTVAAQKAAIAGQRISLVRANLVELNGLADTAFDYATCLFSTLGMISGRAQREHFLHHAFRLLKPGGLFVLHVHNAGFHARTRQGRGWLWRDLFKRFRGADDAGDFVMPPHEGLAGLALHHFTRGEAKRALRRAGFRVLWTEPVSLAADCRQTWPWWFGCVRAYGYLFLCRR